MDQPPPFWQEKPISGNEINVALGNQSLDDISLAEQFRDLQMYLTARGTNTFWLDIDLSGNVLITDKGVERVLVPFLQKHPWCLRLRLYGTGMGGRGLRCLHDFVREGWVQELHFSHLKGKVTEEDVLDLLTVVKESYRYPQRRSLPLLLRLERNHFNSPDGILRKAEHMGLRYRCPVDQSERDELKESRRRAAKEQWDAPQVEAMVDLPFFLDQRLQPQPPSTPPQARSKSAGLSQPMTAPWAINPPPRPPPPAPPPPQPAAPPKAPPIAKQRPQPSQKASSPKILPKPRPRTATMQRAMPLPEEKPELTGRMPSAPPPPAAPPGASSRATAAGQEASSPGKKAPFKAMPKARRPAEAAKAPPSAPAWSGTVPQAFQRLSARQVKKPLQPEALLTSEEQMEEVWVDWHPEDAQPPPPLPKVRPKPKPKPAPPKAGSVGANKKPKVGSVSAIGATSASEARCPERHLVINRGLVSMEGWACATEGCSSRGKLHSRRFYCETCNLDFCTLCCFFVEGKTKSQAQQEDDEPEAGKLVATLLQDRSPPRPAEPEEEPDQEDFLADIDHLVEASQASTFEEEDDSEVDDEAKAKAGQLDLLKYDNACQEDKERQILETQRIANKALAQFRAKKEAFAMGGSSSSSRVLPNRQADRQAHDRPATVGSLHERLRRNPPPPSPPSSGNEMVSRPQEPPYPPPLRAYTPPLRSKRAGGGKPHRKGAGSKSRRAERLAAGASKPKRSPRSIRRLATYRPPESRSSPKSSIRPAAEQVEVSVADIGFSQATCSDIFQDGRSVQSLIDDLMTGKKSPQDKMFRDMNIFEIEQGHLRSKDNRRLYALKEYQRLSGKPVRITAWVWSLKARRMWDFFDSNNDHTDGVRIRLRQTKRKAVKAELESA